MPSRLRAAGPESRMSTARPERRRAAAGAVLALALFGIGSARAGDRAEVILVDSWSADQFHELHPHERYQGTPYAAHMIYSYAVNTYPDGWAALKAGPYLDAPRLAQIPEGTLFREIGRVPGWVRVKFKSGESGWIAARLVGCCRAPSP